MSIQESAPAAAPPVDLAYLARLRERVRVDGQGFEAVLPDPHRYVEILDLAAEALRAREAGGARVERVTAGFDDVLRTFFGPVPPGAASAADLDERDRLGLPPGGRR